MTRTYLPTLLAIVRQLCLFTTRYDQTIRQFLPPNSITAYNALRAACDLFLEVVQPPPLGP